MLPALRAVSGSAEEDSLRFAACAQLRCKRSDSALQPADLPGRVARLCCKSLDVLKFRNRVHRRLSAESSRCSYDLAAPETSGRTGQDQLQPYTRLFSTLWHFLTAQAAETCAALLQILWQYPFQTVLVANGLYIQLRMHDGKIWITPDIRCTWPKHNPVVSSVSSLVTWETQLTRITTAGDWEMQC